MKALTKMLALTLTAGLPALSLIGCGVDARGEASAAVEAVAEVGEASQALGSEVVPFDTFSWSYFTNNDPGHPRLLGNEAILIPDDAYNAAAVALYRQDLFPPYRVELELRTYDEDGGPIWNSADGVVVMVGKDRAAYGVPPTGGERGFIRDGSGYGVHFVTYGYRRIVLTNGHGQELASVPYEGTYTGGEWRSVRVDVESNGIRVLVGGTPVLSWAGTVSRQFGGIGLGAATGGADSEHRVRNVRITPIVKLPVHSNAGSPITISNAKLDNGTNALFSLQPGQSFSVATDYTIYQSSYCPGCIDQILLGIAPNQPQACAYDGIPSMSGTSGSATVTMEAPTTPGIHFLRFRYAQDYSCNLGWWGVDGAPTDANNFGVIYVKQDAAACSHATCSTGARLAASCDSCTAKVCAADPYCCDNAWDSLCVSEVKDFCGATCN